ncbi:conserved hypothetical protein [Luminiphilus syltensis NOR5-1B]|uniref:Transmembrane protein n=1 Tax=Luminiphilus syltensis NOR5-1B TaxID=565045 RepID=B8KX70_9GAMM|nr:DUF962 domain-containing protein [Luminiphilus syltensis]EED36355.1 conserved hypothetical protein [Luminiphilus syltensis NOR5-1B]
MVVANWLSIGSLRMVREYKTLREFYSFYLSEHSNPVNKALHFFGTGVSLVLFVYLFATAQFVKIPLVLLVGYGFAWLGHFVFEKNKPATFQYPLYSFICDFKLFFDILRGKITITR